MSAPLFEKLNNYKNCGMYPFHMPGHKMGAGIKADDIFSMDITEIDGFDNLHHAEGVIKEAQEMCAKAFGAEESFFLVNGSSCGIIASIIATCSDKPIIVGRNCHKSVFDGMVLSGAKPTYIMPEVVQGYPIFGAISPKEVRLACEATPNAGAVIIVSPTFEGVVSDVEKIANIVHENGMVLIVDEAHGAHFNFHEYFPKSAVKCGADIIIQSVHKTLPSPTQTSILHICGNRVNRERLTKCLTMTQSTSPSYIFMGMLDKCRDYLDNDGKKDFEIYVERLEALRTRLKNLRKFRMMDEKIIGESHVFDLDKGKIVIFSNGINGIKVGEILRREGKIEPEMCCPTHFIAMTSVCDTEDGLNRLAEALPKIESEIADTADSCIDFIYPKPEACVLPRIAFNGEKEEMDIDLSEGRVSAEFVIPYPPGIPLLSPGEKITAEILNTIKKYKLCNVNIIGMKDSALEKIMVLQ